MPEACQSNEFVALSEPSPCDSCRWRNTCATLGTACRAFVAYHKGQPEHRWRLEITQPRADLGELLGLLKITDEQLDVLIEEHGVYGAAEALRYSYHRLRKRIDASEKLARWRKVGSVAPAA